MLRTAISTLFLSFLALACESKEAPNDASEEAGDTADDSASCELWEGDATYPGDCECESPGEECVQGCLIPDGAQTCADVCAALGETCVENACDGGTYVGGWTCPAPGEYDSAVEHPCDQPVPIAEDDEYGVACCCTR